MLLTIAIYAHTENTDSDFKRSTKVFLEAISNVVKILGQLNFEEKQ